MSQRADVARDCSAAPAEGAAHVFDQTNGVLGAEHGAEPGEHRHGDRKPSSSFGVPPVVSL